MGSRWSCPRTEYKSYVVHVCIMYEYMLWLNKHELKAFKTL